MSASVQTHSLISVFNLGDGKQFEILKEASPRVLRKTHLRTLPSFAEDSHAAVLVLLKPLNCPYTMEVIPSSCKRSRRSDSAKSGNRTPNKVEDHLRTQNTTAGTTHVQIQEIFPHTNLLRIRKSRIKHVDDVEMRKRTRPLQGRLVLQVAYK
ncbi:hypothetical protein T265_09384 [Opisthorchis viverrini]|uniref:Uncharacterized protein n=2 Tax=Opisthorchis viverrini TaxID=6198 RepID=A0A075A557_OPIVI|nr:hypothetical protein T265_09384 [Opisthorchis viverrini]KER22554.1 hypothetical protein T265_09384 [Opisthorchis viverrini]